MGQLALGLAGAGIGFAFGGPTGAQIGWIMGSFAWNLLDPPKIEGPRLQDTKVRGADYGSMRPILYGMARIGGLGMGQGSTSDGPNKFTEHEEKSGGKGGPEVTNYRYTLSFFNEICEGPIVGVQRRWANGRLITEAGAESNDDWPFTLYLGDTTQMPDPTMETIYGVGGVNPMRGVAYEAVEEKDVEDFGRARPNVEYEAFTAGGDIPWRFSSFAPWGTPLYSNFYHCAATYRNGVITTVEMGNGSDDTFKIRQFRTDGTQIGSTITQSCPLPGTNSVFAVTNANIFMRTTGTDDVWFYYNENTQAIEQGFTIAGGGSRPSVVGAPMLKIGSFIYSVGHVGFDWYLSKWSADTDAGGALVDTVFIHTADSGFQFAPSLGTSSEDDVLYLLWEDHDGQRMRKIDASDLSTIWTLEPSDIAGSYLEHSGIAFHVQNGLVCNGRNVSSGVYEIRLVRVDGTSATDYGSTIPTTNTVSTQSIWLGGGLLLDPIGVYSINPPPVAVILGDIVADLLQRAGLNSGQYDVSDLTQEVRGFVVGSQMTVRNAIDILRKAYFFDVTEFDGKVVCVNRGHSAIATIPDGDLAAHEPGSEAPEPLEMTRVPEAELPRTVFINFYNYDADYQQGSQYWRRTVTRSQSDVTLDLPLVFTPTEALDRAQWHMHFAWLERDRFTWSTTRKWSKLTPTDVVVVRGVNIRITNKVESPNGLIKFEGVRAFAGGFTAGGPVTEPIDGSTPGSGGGGQPPATTPTALVATQLVLLDIPIVSQGDYPFGFYAAACPAADGRWPGYALFKSIDGGSTYSQVASTAAASTIGSVTAGSLASYALGDVVDESTCTVVLTDPDATLQSITGIALTNGGNLCAIRSGSTWELCNFRDAVLVSPATYELTGFLRGRKGTPTAGHATGDAFVLLPTLNVDAPQTELNVALKYKAVTFGLAVADAVAVDFTNTGEAAGGSNGDSGGGSFDTTASNFPVAVTYVTTTTYTLLEADRAHLVSFSNASAVTVTLPSTLPKKWWCYIENLGAGIVTLSPAGGALIDNAGTAVTVTPAHGALLVFDGTNYWTMRGLGGIRTLDAGVTVDAVAQAINAVAPLSMASAGSGQTNLTHDDSGVTAATYGSGSSVAQITVDAKGHVTSASSIAISGLTTSTGSFTPGSIIFAGATGALAEDNTNLNFDNANNKIGMGTTSPAVPLHITRASPTDPARVRLAYTDTTTTTGTDSGAGLDLFNDSSVQGNFCLHPVKFNNGAAAGKFLPNQIVLNAWALNGLLLTTYDSGAPIVFMTNANGSSSNERMRIAGNGTITLATYPVITAGTAGRIPYATTAGQLTDSASLQFDATNVQVGIGGTPSYHVHAQGSSNAGHEICAHASGSGSGTFAAFRLRTSTQTENFISVAGTGFTTAGFIAAQDMQVAAASGRLNILTIGNQSIRFFTNSSTSFTTTTERMSIDGAGNVVVGRAALATSATDGFLYIPTCAGAPTGTPTTKTGMVPLIFDTTNNNLYIYNGGWKKTTTFA